MSEQISGKMIHANDSHYWVICAYIKNEQFAFLLQILQ